MPQLRTIEIDFDIHKLIEAERSNFDEPPFVALRRLLALPPALNEMPLSTSEGRSGRPFIEEGVQIPHGSLAKMEYLRGQQVYEGSFIDGKLVVNGRAFDSLSGAASELAVTKKGKRTKLNGWFYWRVRLPGEIEWKSLRDLRIQAQLRSAAAAGAPSSS